MSIRLAVVSLCAALLLPPEPLPAAGPAPAPSPAAHIGQPPPPTKTPKFPGKVIITPVDGLNAPKPGGVPTTPSSGGAALSGATTPGSSRVGATSRDGVVRGRSGRAGATTNAGATLQVLDTWELWWLHNRDEFLDIKSRQAAATAVSGSPGHLLGRGRRTTRTSGHRPSRARMDLEVVPALLELMTRHKERELLNAAALAVGRVASSDVAPRVEARLAELLAHDERQIQASAALGMGALGAASAEGHLLALLRDDSNGRRLTGGGEVDRLPRSISALSLGLLGDARSAWSLMDVARRLPDREAEVKACAIAALGLLDAGSPRTAVARTLLAEMLDERDLDPSVASVIPTTLAKLGAREAVPRLVELLEDRAADRLVRQSAAIALGRLASLDDEAVVDALVYEMQDGRDPSTRQFALIALGRMGAAGASDPEAHRTLRLRLERELTGRGRKPQRTWAALAAAIHGRGHVATRNALVPTLRAAHADENDPNARAAFALALGLLQDTGATDALRADVQSGDEVLAGFSAVALGLLEDREALGPLRVLLQRKGSSPGLRGQVSTALALLADVDSVPGLVELLRSGVTYEEQAALSKAIGLIGDERAIAPLLELALDEGAKIHDRGFACVALGLLGERTRLPFQAALRSSTNYLARIDPLVQVAELL